MPCGDGTGPLGAGPRTGWGLGYRGGFQMTAAPNSAALRGRLGRGHGGRGWRHQFYATGLTGWQRGEGSRGWRAFPAHPASYDMPVPTRAQQVSMLQADLRCLEQNAELLRRRIEELNAQSAEKATP